MKIWPAFFGKQHLRFCCRVCCSFGTLGCQTFFGTLRVVLIVLTSHPASESLVKSPWLPQRYITERLGSDIEGICQECVYPMSSNIFTLCCMFREHVSSPLCMVYQPCTVTLHPETQNGHGWVLTAWLRLPTDYSNFPKLLAEAEQSW